MPNAANVYCFDGIALNNDILCSGIKFEYVLGYVYLVNFVSLVTGYLRSKKWIRVQPNMNTNK